MPPLILPNFKLNLEQILPILKHKIAEGVTLSEQLSKLSTPSFDNLVAPLSMFHAELHEFWSPVSHLNNVANNERLRNIYEGGALLLSDFYTNLAQSQGLYQTYVKLSQSSEYSKLSAVQQKIIQDTLLEFELSGVGLPEAERTAFKACEQKLVEATTKFEQNLMDAIRAWHYTTSATGEIEGIPEAVLAQAKNKASNQADQDHALAAQLSNSANPTEQDYFFGIDAPTYLAIMGYAKNPSLRQRFYQAYVTRASESTPEFDNSNLMVNILNTRAEEARILKYRSFADYATVKRMAKNPETILSFLRDLAQRSRAKAEADWKELQYFAESYGHQGPLNAWDIPYLSERLKEQQLGFNEEQLRPYFPINQVFQGLIALVSTLFGIRVQETSISAWHQDVRFLEVYDTESDQLRGGIYVDLYARADKRSGAWMDECQSLRTLKDGRKQLPLAFLNANFLPPSPNAEAYLTHEEVLTLFHELGHVLQHLLTEIPYPDVGGIQGIPWDAVELPSQFMENFCYEAEILKNLSCHKTTGAGLDEKLIHAIRSSRSFQSGLIMLRQLEFALFDMNIHLQQHTPNAAAIQKILDELRQEIALIIPPAFNRFQHSFSHIFAGGYAAGYYSYKWAEVLSSDAFSRFEEEGILNKSVGRAFRDTILAQGGSREALDVFIDFRGRSPKIDALLQHSGIIN